MHLFWCSSSAGLFLSTPSARRATNSRYTRNQGRRISIHALREEGDSGHKIFLPSPVTFLSTPSARRATLGCRVGAHIPAYFYPRPPRGGRRRGGSCAPAGAGFLSTPSSRRATNVPGKGIVDVLFLSTPSSRRATVPCVGETLALRDFYPRPPRGGRH